MAKLDKYRYPWPWRDKMDERLRALHTDKEYPSDVDLEAEFAAEEAALNALLEASDKLADGEIVGAVLQFGRGDGYAYYIVTKEKPLTVQWIPVMDAWSVETALIRGLTKADVLAQLGRNKRLAKLFPAAPRKAS